MRGTVAIGLVIAFGVLVLAAVVLIILSRKSHLRSWRFGIFYEGEDRFNGKGKEKE